MNGLTAPIGKVLTSNSSRDSFRYRPADGGALSPSREGVDPVGVDPSLYFVALELYEVTDLQLRNSPLCDDATHVANRDAQLVCELLNADQRRLAVAGHVLLQSSLVCRPHHVPDPQCGCRVTDQFALAGWWRISPAGSQRTLSRG